jgi:hypothetical protein
MSAPGYPPEQDYDDAAEEQTDPQPPEPHLASDIAFSFFIQPPVEVSCKWSMNPPVVVQVDFRSQEVANVYGVITAQAWLVNEDGSEIEVTLLDPRDGCILEQYTPGDPFIGEDRYGNDITASVYVPKGGSEPHVSGLIGNVNTTLSKIFPVAGAPEGASGSGKTKRSSGEKKHGGTSSGRKRHCGSSRSSSKKSDHAPSSSSRSNPNHDSDVPVTGYLAFPNLKVCLGKVDPHNVPSGQSWDSLPDQKYRLKISVCCFQRRALNYHAVELLSDSFTSFQESVVHKAPSKLHPPSLGPFFLLHVVALAADRRAGQPRSRRRCSRNSTSATSARRSRWLVFQLGGGSSTVFVSFGRVALTT